MDTNSLFDIRLKNWASWARNRAVIPCSCRSLESHYKAPPIWHYPELKAEININDAIVVERELVSPSFPKRNMAVIVYAHVYPWKRFEVALRRINKFDGKMYVKPANFEDVLHQSITMLKNRLDTCNNNQDVIELTQFVLPAQAAIAM